MIKKTSEELMKNLLNGWKGASFIHQEIICIRQKK